MPLCQPQNDPLIDAWKLPPNAEVATGIWVCPGRTPSVIPTPNGQPIVVGGCKGGEHYAEIRSGDIWDYCQRAIVRAEREWGRIGPHTTRLVVGRIPLSKTFDNEHFVVLSRDTNHNQLRWQTGHEAFHRVCTPIGTLHWVHEMLAQVFTVHCLYDEGHDAYAHHCEEEERAKAAGSDPREMHSWTGGNPVICYSIALSCGVRLVDQYGWEEFKRLATSFDSSGQPDFEAWSMALPGGGAAARRIVGV